MKTLHNLVSVTKFSKATKDKKFDFVIIALYLIERGKLKGLKNPFN